MWLQAALLVGQLWLGELTRQRPKRISFKEFVENNEPSETRPIPYAGGEIELTPVRQWYGDYKQRAVERDSKWTDYIWAGLFAGFLDFITVAYRYYIGEMFPLCFGPDTHVRRITINDRLVFLSTADNAGGGFLIDDPQAWGGDQPPGEGGEYAFCRLTRGNYTDPANAYLESLLATPPNKTPSLRGISALVKLGPSGETESGYFAAGGVGVIPRLKEWKVTIGRYPDNLNTGFNKIGKHMNPMEVIYEWSTSIEYGARTPLEELNIPSWQQAAEDLHAEGTGWSGRIESSTSPREVIDDVLAQIDGVLDPSPSLGLTMRLIRRTYSLPSLRTFTRDDITRVIRFSAGTYEDTKNKVQVEFPNQDNNFEESKGIYIDPANQQIQTGRSVPETKSFLGVADGEQANVLSTRDGRAISLPRAGMECFARPSWGRLSYRSEVVVFEWESPSISIVMRVQEITPNGPDEKDFHLVLIEDQFATGLRTFGEPGGTSHVDPGAGLDTAPPSASWNEAEFAPDGLTFTLQLTNTNQFQATITGGIIFGSYAPGGQLARIWVTEPGGVQTLSPIRLSPDDNNEATFTWPALTAGVYEFCVQTFSLRGATNAVKVCTDIAVAAIGSPSPSASVSPSISPSASVSPSSSASPSTSASQSASLSPSSSISASPSVGAGCELLPGAPTTNLQFDLVGECLLGGDATKVLSWEDAAPAGNDASQTNQITDTTKETNEINGLAVIRPGITEWSFASPIAITSNFTYIAVLRPSSLSSSRTLISGASGALQVRLESGRLNVVKTLLVDMGTASTQLTTSAFFTVAVTYDGSILRFYLNGATDGTTSVSQIFSANVSTLFINKGNGSENFAGDIAEQLFWDAVLTPATHLLNGGGGVSDALRTKYAHY